MKGCIGSYQLLVIVLIMHAFTVPILYQEHSAEDKFSIQKGCSRHFYRLHARFSSLLEKKSVIRSNIFFFHSFST